MPLGSSKGHHADGFEFCPAEKPPPSLGAVTQFRVEDVWINLVYQLENHPCAYSLLPHFVTPFLLIMCPTLMKISTVYHYVQTGKLCFKHYLQSRLRNMVPGLLSHNTCVHRMVQRKCIWKRLIGKNFDGQKINRTKVQVYTFAHFCKRWGLLEWSMPRELQILYVSRMLWDI